MVSNIEVKFKRIDQLKENFTQLSNNVFFLLKGEPTAYMVYSYLNFRYNRDKGYAFPSIKKIQEDLGIKSNNTVIKAIKRLEKLSLIKVIRSKESKNRKANNKYVVYYPVSINIPVNWTEDDWTLTEFTTRVDLS